MTVHIEGIHLAILVIACLVGYGVYRRSRTQSTPGNVSEAIMAGAAVVATLVLIITGAEAGGGQSAPTERDSPPVSQPSAVSSATPAP
jgi:hypothetical protein